MMESNVHIASLQIPDLSAVSHRIAVLYSQIQYLPEFPYLIEKFFTVLFFTPTTLEQHKVNFQSNEYLYQLLAADTGGQIPDHFYAFMQDLFDVMEDKIDTMVNQVQTLKTILTGSPMVSALKFEKHSTGWYIVIY